MVEDINDPVLQFLCRRAKIQKHKKEGSFAVSNRPSAEGFKKLSNCLFISGVKVKRLR